MTGEPFLEKVKAVVYTAILPIYLWSIGFKSLDEYTDELYEWERRRRGEI